MCIYVHTDILIQKNVLLNQHLIYTLCLSMSMLILCLAKLGPINRIWFPHICPLWLLWRHDHVHHLYRLWWHLPHSGHWCKPPGLNRFGFRQVLGQVSHSQPMLHNTPQNTPGSRTHRNLAIKAATAPPKYREIWEVFVWCFLVPCMPYGKMLIEYNSSDKNWFILPRKIP